MGPPWSEWGHRLLQETLRPHAIGGKAASLGMPSARRRAQVLSEDKSTAGVCQRNGRGMGTAPSGPQMTGFPPFGYDSPAILREWDQLRPSGKDGRSCSPS